MNNNTNLNIQFNGYGIPRCTNTPSSVDRNTASKISIFVKQVLQNLPFKNNPEEEICSIIVAKNADRTIKITLENLKGRGPIPISLSEDIQSIAADIFLDLRKDFGVLKLDFQTPPLSNYFPPIVIPHKSPISDRLLAHIHADEFGVNSSLEGISSNKTLTYLRDFLKERLDNKQPISGLSEGLIFRLTQASLAGEPETIKYLLDYHIQENTPFLLAGGWRTVEQGESHCIIYEIVPDSSNGQATMRLYDISGESERAWSETEFKRKTWPTVEWRGISLEKFKQDDFLETFKELKQNLIVPESKKATLYNSKDIFGALKEILAPTEEHFLEGRSIAIAPFMTPQRSGFCSWKSLLAYLRTIMNTGDYKRFKLEVKIQSLSNAVALSPEDQDSLTPPARWQLIQKSFSKLCRAIEKQYCAGVIDERYVMECRKLLSPVHAWIQNNKHLSFGGSPFTLEQEISSFTLETFKPLYDPLEEGIDSSRLSFSFAYNELSKLDLQDPKTISANLDRLIKKTQSWSPGEIYPNHLILVDSVKELSMEENFWQKACENDPKKAQELINSLGLYLKIYFKTCFTVPNADTLFPERILVALKILYIQTKLAKVVCGEELKPCDTSLSELLNKSLPLQLSFHFFDQKSESEFQKLLNWLAEGKPSDFDAIVKPSINESYCSKGRDYRNPTRHFSFETGLLGGEPQFFVFLYSILPNLQELMIHDRPNFASLSTADQKALIFTSRHVPEWIRSMRDSFIYYDHLIHEVVLRQPSLNPAKDLDIQFHLVKQDHSMLVKVFLTGVETASKEEDAFSDVPPDLAQNLKLTYPSLKNEKLKRFLAHVLTRTYQCKEKDLISEQWAQFQNNWSRDDIEEFKEFGYLFIDSELRIPSILEYFDSHPEMIMDPDFQNLLQRILFQNGSLNFVLGIEGFGKKLVDFIHTHIERSRVDNQIQTLVFLYRLSRYLESYYPHNSLQKRISNLRDLLHLPGLNRTQMSCIYAELAAAVGSKKQMDPQDVQDFLIGTTHVRAYPLPPSFTNAYFEKELAESMIKHSEAIYSTLVISHEANQSLLNSILKAVKPEAQDAAWRKISSTGKFPEFQTISGKKYEYFPLNAEMMEPQVFDQIPYHFQDNPLFKTLFPQVERAKQLSGLKIAFQDRNQIQTIVQQQIDQDPIIDQCRTHQQWYRYVPAEVFIRKNTSDAITCAFSSRYLVQHYTHWQSLEEQPPRILIVDPKTGLNTYEATLEFDENGDYEIIKVRRLSDGAILGALSPDMTAFEDPHYIHQWYDQEGKLIEIELPRYSLSFKIDQRFPDKFRCQESTLERFYLNRGETLKKLRRYRHYLVLENDQKVKKAILPQHHFLSPQSTSDLGKAEMAEITPFHRQDVFELRYRIDQNLELNDRSPQKFQTYTVMKKGRLFTKSRESNLYLAEIALLVQDYKQAAHYLKQFGPKLSAYTPEERKILKNLSSMDLITGNCEGNVFGIQTYAAYLLLKNTLQFSKNNSDDGELGKILRNNYVSYLQHYNNVLVMKLSKDEELYILRALKNFHFSNQLKTHYKALKGKDKPSKAYEWTPPSPPSLDFNKILYDSRQMHCYQSLLKRPLSILRTRLRSDYVNNFIGVYELIFCKQMSAEELQKLRCGLVFWKHNAASESSFLMANLLISVVDHKELFPPWIPNYKPPFEEWWPKILEAGRKAAKLYPLTVPYGSSLPKFNFKTRIEWKTTETTNTEPLRGDLQIPLDPLKNLMSNFEKIPFSPRIVNQNKKSLKDALEELLVLNETPDPLVTEQVSHLKTDMVDLKPDVKENYTLSPESLKNVTTTLNSIKDARETKLASLKEEILKITAQTACTPFGQARLNFFKWSGQHPPLKLDELIVSYGKQDPETLKKRNPALSDHDIQAIYNKVSEYLLQFTYKQQVERALHTIQQIKGLNIEDEELRQELVQQFAEGLLTERCYNPSEKPAFLVFEYFSDILMRKNQVQMIDDFLNGKPSNRIMELIMGSGKSKVLMPLLGLLRADGKTLSILIVPQPLFQSISSDTQTILRDAFGVSLHSLDFDRHTTFTYESLKNILEELKSIQKNKECLIMTHKSVHCLILKFIEKAVEHFSDPNHPKEMPKELMKMREILALMSSKGLPLLDEADLLLNTLHEISFSQGKPCSPSPAEIAVIADLFQILYTDPKIKSYGKIETDPDPDQQAPVLTEKIYHELVKPHLAKAYLQLLKAKKPEENLEFFKSLNRQQEELILDYLCRKKGREQAAQAFYDAQLPHIKELLSMAGEEISRLLPFTLTRPLDEKYGVDEEKNGLLAIPFTAATIPLRGSEFSNHHVTMNYTLQSYIRKGIPKRILLQQLKQLQEAANQEMREYKDKTVEQTNAWKVYEKMKGNLQLPFFNLNDPQIELLLKHINSSLSIRLEIVQSTILLNIMIFDKKISSSSHNLVSFFDRINGFTGTLWNSASMHRKIDPVSAKGTDALTLNLLWDKSYSAIHVIKSGTIKEMLKEIPKEQYDLIADAGGYFKNQDNQKNAEQLFEISKKPVVFYDANNDQMVWNGKSKLPLAEAPLKVHERVTFLDQAHTTGADVTQKPKAIGLVTIGPNMLLRDLLQSVWRLRCLDKAQKVEFIVSTDVEKIIKQTLKIAPSQALTFIDILKFTVINQANQQGKDNFKALNQELNDVLQKILLDTLLNPKSSSEECAQAVHALKSTWIKEAFASPAVLYGKIPQELDANTVSNTLYEAAVANAASRGIHDTIVKDQFKEISARYRKCLPASMSLQSGNEEMTVEQEQQKVAEKHTEIETEVKSHDNFSNCGEIIEETPAPFKRVDYFSDALYPPKLRKDPYSSSTVYGSPPILSFETYLKHETNLNAYANLFEGIDLSFNMFQYPDQQQFNTKDIKFFGQFRKPIHYFLVDNERVILINAAEAGLRLKHGFRNLYNTELGCLSSNNGASLELLKKIAKIKFLNGDSNYTLKEIEILRKWFVENGPKKMFEFYSKEIVKGHLLKIKRFEDSPLQRLFREFEY